MQTVVALLVTFVTTYCIAYNIAQIRIAVQWHCLIETLRNI